MGAQGRHTSGEHDHVYRVLAEMIGVPVHSRGPLGQDVRKSIAAVAGRELRELRGMTVGELLQLADDVTRPAA